MINFTDEFTWRTRDIFRNIKKYIAIASVAFWITSMVYMVYWVAIKTDNSILEYTNEYFAPLVRCLFLNIDDIDSYRSASFAYFSFGIITFIVGMFCDSIKKRILDEHNRIIAAKLKYEQQKIIVANQRLVNSKINEYSICLSADYRSEFEISENIKQKFNNALFEKVVFGLDKMYLNTKILDKALIVLGSDFRNYDIVYAAILRNLAKTKRIIKTKYEIDLIPSITTDAYEKGKSDYSDIILNHFEIQGCNFKNRAISTTNFSEIYKKNKINGYMGVPIGEYAIFKGDEPITYELNMVFKNLANTLDSLKV